jgi:predicted amidohydrolase
MADEHDHYAPGHMNVTIDLHGWRLRPQVCYDLRFPVWARNKMLDGKHEYDILLNVANWPAARVSAWDTLLKARAIENHAYSVGVNRVGVDGNGIAYFGHSGVYDPKGKTLAFLENKQAAYATKLNYAELARYREQFPAQLDADNFTIL